MAARMVPRVATRRTTLVSPSANRVCINLAREQPLRSFSRSAFRRTEARKGTKTVFEDDGFNPLDKIAVHRQIETEIAYYRKRMRFAAFGAGFSFLAICFLTFSFPIEKASGSDSLDAPTSTPPFPDTDATVSHIGVELVETGTSTIPHFPRTITLPTNESTKTPALPSGIGDNDSEYTLLGLGVRTVSFLGIQVYVVGIYVANSDLTALQAAFVKEAANAEAASTLIADEKDSLRKRLLDPVDGEQIWEKILTQCGARTVVRIVPTRNTDFPHLRDGFERGIKARVKTRKGWVEDESLGESVQALKAIFGRGQLAKGSVMLLERGRDGELTAWVQGIKEADFSRMGEVKDERISRLMWLNYLGGKSVASEPCRKSVVEGVMAVVERPIGTAETQVI